MEYNPIAGIILPPKQPYYWHCTATKRTRAYANMYASYNSLTLLPLLKPFYLPFYKRGSRGASFFYSLGRAIIKGGIES